MHSTFKYSRVSYRRCLRLSRTLLRVEKGTELSFVGNQKES